MKKNINKPLLLIGPGSSKADLTPEMVNKYTTLVFSGDLTWFHEHDVVPDYFCFLDPYTLWYISENFKKGYYRDEWLNKLKNHSTIFYNDFYFDHPKDPNFYTKGLSTEHGKAWLTGEFKHIIFPFISNLFKNKEKLPTQVIYDNFNIYKNLNRFSDNHNILIHSNTRLNTDKFSTFVIPLVLYYFNTLEIFSIGFGDYNLPRYSASQVVNDYDGFKFSFDTVKKSLLNVLQYYNMNVNFLNPTSYYKNLNWKETMEKITFCIPSKTNLRYLKTCIPSIRKNAFRKDHEIIIFVDSDEDGTIEWLDSIKDEYNVSYYVNPDLGNSLYGIGRAYDYCIKKSTTDIFMIFHADMMLGKNADLKAFNHLKEKTVVCSTRVEPPIHPNAGEKILEDFGMWPEEFKEKEFDKYVSTYLSTNKTTEGIFAPWMMYKSEFLNILGGHDPIMHSCREDSDLFNRMHLAGFKFIQPWSSLVYHLTGRGAGSFDGDPERHKQWQADMNKSTLEFIRKWGTNVNHTPLMKPIVYPVYNKTVNIINSNPQLEQALEPWFNGKEGIAVEVDGNNFTQQDFQIIQQLSAIIQDSGEIGKFKLGNLKINITNLETFEDDLIFITNSHNEKN